MKEEDLYLSWEFQNNLGYIGGVDIDTLEKEVVIWVEDSFYTFEIPFDKFLEIAKKVKEVKEVEKENMDNAIKYARQYRYAKTEKGKQRKQEANKRYYLRRKEKAKNE